MTGTLRTMLIRELPHIKDIPEYTWDEQNKRYIHNEDWAHTRKLIQDAAAWVARSYASSIHEVSDSTIDTHLSMVSTLTKFNEMIYGNDETMELWEAIDLWLDDEYAAEDFYMSSYDANVSLPSRPMPELFGYFNPDSDSLYSE